MIRLTRTSLFIVAFLLVFAVDYQEAEAQTSTPPDSTHIMVHPSNPDAMSDTVRVMIENKQRYSHGVPMSKDPLWAAMRSVVFPGWGQVYVENWIFATVFAGTEIGLLYGAYVQNDRYVTALEDSKNVKKDADRILLEQSANFYRDDRNKLFWYIAGLTVLSSMDAYVEAHLYDFHIDPLLTSPPANDGVQIGFQLTFSF